jgi:hypothetical protein
VIIEPTRWRHVEVPVRGPSGFGAAGPLGQLPRPSRVRVLPVDEAVPLVGTPTCTLTAQSPRSSHVKMVPGRLADGRFPWFADAEPTTPATTLPCTSGIRPPSH